jgi:nucleoside-diphosphate-sugar epimerase
VTGAARAGRRVLVTGATGFIGSHLVRRLAADGCDVHALVRAGSDARRVPPAGVVTAHVADGDTERLVDLVAELRPAAVFHLAAYFVAEHRAPDVAPLVASNVLLTAQLAEAASAAGGPAFINTGTSWQHYRDAPYMPVALYAATKQAAEDVLAFYADATPLRVVTLRLFDTYGPADPRPKLLAALRRAAAGETLRMSPGEQLIDLVHVDDVVDAYVAAWAHADRTPGAAAEAFAVSSGAPLPLRDLAGLFGRVAGRPLAIEWGGRAYRAREVMVPWSAGTPVPGWRPRVGLEDGLRRLLRDEPLSPIG